jgi:hypothetical protein
MGAQQLHPELGWRYDAHLHPESIAQEQGF